MLRELEDVLQPLGPNRSHRQVVTVQGPPGIGKTQLILKFVRQYQHVYSAVLWLDGSARATLLRNIAEVATRISDNELGHPAKYFAQYGSGELDKVASSVLEWLALASNRQWLLVIDNVDNGESTDPVALAIDQYFPEADHGMSHSPQWHTFQCHTKFEVGSIIICTQREDLYRLGREIRLRTFSIDEGLELVENIVPRSIEGRGQVPSDGQHPAKLT